MTRWGYRPGEIVERTGLSRSVVDRMVLSEGIQRKKIGEAVILEARGCERVFGFPTQSKTPVDPEILAELQEFIG